jgi:hypothetical protein
MATTVKLPYGTVQESLQKYSKIINQFSLKSSKTYFVFDQGKLDLYFGEANSSFSMFSVPIENTTKVAFITDFSKFLNSLTKIKVQDSFILQISDKSLIVKSDLERADKIQLSIATVEPTQLATIEGLIPTLNLESLQKFPVDEDTEAFFKSSIALMTSFSTESSVFLDQGSGIYADRSIIFKMPLNAQLNNVYFNMNTLKSLLLYKSINNKFYFDREKNGFFWESEDKRMQSFWLQESSVVDLPSASDLEELSPAESNVLIFNSEVLKDSIDFFNGFYEGSVWKTIAFDLNNMIMSYSSVMSDIEKGIEVVETKWLVAPHKFSIIADSLKAILSSQDGETLITMISDSTTGAGAVFKTDKFWALLAYLD